ncbi:MAG: hypothetical protein WC547_10660, partial [Candidatus Omnitrophota bacterium]
MKRVILLICILCSAMCNSECFALDWKTLHERSDKTDLRTAIARVDKAPDSLDDLYVLGLVYLDVYEIGKAQKTFDKMVAL